MADNLINSFKSLSSKKYTPQFGMCLAANAAESEEGWKDVVFVVAVFSVYIRLGCLRRLFCACDVVLITIGFKLYIYMHCMNVYMYISLSIYTQSFIHPPP